MRPYLILFLLPVFFISCSSPDKKNSDDDLNNTTIQNPEYGTWQNQENPVEFELIQTFGEESASDEDVFASITAMFTDKDQNLYVLDDQLSRLISFDKEGEIRWVTGTKGRGPGDFENAWNMIWDGNKTIYISNIARTRIDLFNLDGEFLKTLSTANPKLKDLNIHGFMDSKLVVSRTILGTFSKEFMLLNPSTPDSIHSSFTIDVTGDLDVPAGMSWFSSASVLDNQLVVAGLSNYSYSFYNNNRTKTRQINRDFDKIMRPGFFQNDDNRVIGSMGGLNPMVKLGNEFYITTASWPVNVADPDQYMKDLSMGKNRNAIFRNTTDLFDQDFKLLYSIESDGFINDELGLILHSDNESYVYSMNYSPFAHIKKFKLTVNE